MYLYSHRAEKAHARNGSGRRGGHCRRRRQLLQLMRLVARSRRGRGRPPGRQSRNIQHRHGRTTTTSAIDACIRISQPYFSNQWDVVKDHPAVPTNRQRGTREVDSSSSADAAVAVWTGYRSGASRGWHPGGGRKGPGPGSRRSVLGGPAAGVQLCRDERALWFITHN